ncbi:MAG TPA: hypothetical protein VJB82_03615 [Candidatus Peribacterales bacterium]|nr:hypothetical protein [Candidatus Peribacterales bacterium]
METRETPPAGGVELLDQLTAQEVQEAVRRAQEIELAAAATAHTTHELGRAVHEQAEEVLKADTTVEDGQQELAHLREIVHMLLIARATELEETADGTPVSAERTRERIRGQLSGVVLHPEHTGSTAA